MTDSSRSASTGVDTRALVVSALVGAALVLVVVVGPDGSTRDVTLRALAYVLAFRLVMLAYTGRKRNALVVMAVPVIGGVLIAEWWAVLLSLVNGALGLVFGVRRDLPRDPLTPRELALFGAGEATLLAAGVGTGRLLGS